MVVETVSALKKASPRTAVQCALWVRIDEVGYVASPQQSLLIYDLAFLPSLVVVI